LDLDSTDHLPTGLIGAKPIQTSVPFYHHSNCFDIGDSVDFIYAQAAHRSYVVKDRLCRKFELMTRTAIIAAMPDELKPLVRGWRHSRSNGVDLWRWSFEGGEWIAACAGAGVERAARAFAEVEKCAEIDKVISVGWAGALREELLPGRAYDVSCVIDAKTGDRYHAARWHEECILVTSPKVADHADKKRLASTYQAALVEMEAAGVARLARLRGIPFYCIKGISDGYNDNLPDFNRFISTDGQFRLARFVFFVLSRPWYWPALIRMGENSKKAARAMAESLLDFLDERGYIRQQNGYTKLTG
jgi:adenosylhomocysteine nucleosidase